MYLQRRSRGSFLQHVYVEVGISEIEGEYG